MALNDQYNLQLQFDLKDWEGGSYADLTYQVIHRMIKVGPGILRPLYKSLVSVLSNTAPYVKSLSKDTSECIFSLIKTFSSPELLKKREETSRILSNLFEAVNYILLYHDEGNEEFLVSLIKYREVVKINDLKLSEGDLSPSPKRVEEMKKSDPQNAKSPTNPKVSESEKPKDGESVKPQNNEDTENEGGEGEGNEEEKNQEEKSEEGKEPKSEAENTKETENQNGEDIDEDKDQKVASPEQVSENQSEKQPEAAQEVPQVVSSSGKPKEEEKEAPTDSKEESKEDPDSMVDVPLDDIKHNQNNAEGVGAVDKKLVFLSPEWEKEWKKGLNLPNLKQAIQYTDDKARQFLAKNPSPDNNIDADKFVEYLKKSSLKGLLPNQVKILVTTYNGNNSIDTWAISYIWGQIFMRQQEVPLFNIEAIRMFKVNYTTAE